MQQFSLEEVAKHNQSQDLWIVVNNQVYDLSKFGKLHPGGLGVLLPVAGKDCTEQFFSLHREEVLTTMGKKFLIGNLQGQQPGPLRQVGDISQVPYSESSAWSKGFKSLYFKQSHHDFRQAVRKFVDENIRPDASSMEESGQEPSLQMYKLMGQNGILAARIGPGDHMKLFKQLGGVSCEEFDYFHEMIVHEELTLLGCPGVVDGLGIGMVIGLPAVIEFGTTQMKQTVVPEVLRGDKRICLAITDAGAGSDVANLSCTATKSPCGKYYIVTGTKKWITNGTFCDYFTTAVRTGGPGAKGISVLLIERSQGLSTKKIYTSYSPSAGTAYVIFDHVKVPVENLLGKENDGFKLIMHNFNHERWMMAVFTNRSSRLCLEESLKWAQQRKVFGKSLIEQPVIRNKLANMTAQIEAVQNWLENITFQMNKMSYSKQVKFLAGPIGLCKMQSTRVLNYVLDESCQIFGGRAITRTGMGAIIEKMNKARKYTAIYGGSEEIMADMGIKMAMKDFPINAKL